jgi:hypothetical protein
MKLDEARKESRTLQADLLKKEERMIEVELKHERSLLELTNKLETSGHQLASQRQECLALEHQLSSLQAEENELIDNYEQMIHAKSKEIDELAQQLASRVDILQIQENYNTKYKSSNELRSSNELPSSNELQYVPSSSPKSVYEQEEDALSKDRLEQLVEMNQISQIRPSDPN